MFKLDLKERERGWDKKIKRLWKEIESMREREEKQVCRSHSLLIELEL